LEVAWHLRQRFEHGLHALPTSIRRVVVAQILRQRLNVNRIDSANVGVELARCGSLRCNLGDANCHCNNGDEGEY
jgi:hypothetical protein